MPQSPLLPPPLRDAPVAVASLDLRGHILDANRVLLDTGGYAMDELRGRSFLEFLDGDARAEAGARFAALAAGTIDAYRAERRFRTREGGFLDADLRLSLVRGDSGEPLACLAVLQDVTPYKRAAHDAARRAAELQAVLNSIPGGVFIGDEHGKVTAASSAALAALGFASVDDLRSRLDALVDDVRVRDASTGTPLSRSERPFARALRGELVDVDLVLEHGQSGEDRVHRVIAAPVSVDGKIAGAVAISQDVTEQRATREALQMSEARYRALVEQSPLSIQILSPDGRTLHVNKAWERLWGVTFDQIADYNMLEDEQLVERGLMPFIRRAFGGEPVEIPAILYDPNKTLPDRSAYSDPRRWVRAVAYPLKDAHGGVREVVLIHEDMTEQVLADEQRRRVEAERERLLEEAQRAHREIEDASRMKDEFLAMISHELRTPLNAVLGWARILRSRTTATDTAHAISVIERNATAQARLIDDLLDVSRVITGKIRLTLELVDLGAVAASSLESVRPAADAKRIRLDLRVPEPLPPISGDGERLQQVFWNLLSNAVKFNQPDGAVLVSLSADESHVHAEVSDTGIGIASGVLPYVFDRFVQADSSSTRAHSGLGLGLAIVRHVVELHGGTVQAESPGPGNGSTFRFSLPRGRDIPSSTASPSAPDPPA